LGFFVYDPMSGTFSIPSGTALSREYMAELAYKALNDREATEKYMARFNPHNVEELCFQRIYIRYFLIGVDDQETYDSVLRMGKDFEAYFKTRDTLKPEELQAFMKAGDEASDSCHHTTSEILNFFVYDPVSDTFSMPSGSVLSREYMADFASKALNDREAADKYMARFNPKNVEEVCFQRIYTRYFSIDVDDQKNYTRMVRMGKDFEAYFKARDILKPEELQAFMKAGDEAELRRHDVGAVAGAGTP